MHRGNDDSAISAAVEVLMKSSLCLHLPRAMDPYCWARSFSSTTNSFLCLFTPPQSYRKLWLLSFVLACWGITILFFFVSISVCALLSCSIPQCLSLIFLTLAEPPLLTIVLSRAGFSLSHNLHLNETHWEKLQVLNSQPHADKENPYSRFFRATFHSLKPAIILFLATWGQQTSCKHSILSPCKQTCRKTVAFTHYTYIYTPRHRAM